MAQPSSLSGSPRSGSSARHSDKELEAGVYRVLNEHAATLQVRTLAISPPPRKKQAHFLLYNISSHTLRCDTNNINNNVHCSASLNAMLQPSRCKVMQLLDGAMLWLPATPCHSKSSSSSCMTFTLSRYFTRANAEHTCHLVPSHPPPPTAQLSSSSINTCTLLNLACRST